MRGREVQSSLRERRACWSNLALGRDSAVLLRLRKHFKQQNDIVGVVFLKIKFIKVTVVLTLHKFRGTTL